MVLHIMSATLGEKLDTRLLILSCVEMCDGG